MDNQLNNGVQFHENNSADADSDLDTSCLLSIETLDRASPELWPEQFVGVTEYATQGYPLVKQSENPPEWIEDIEKDDLEMLNEFGSLTVANLMEKIRGAQNLAYQLGLEEAREMTRGKFLNILGRGPHRSRKK